MIHVDVWLLDFVKENVIALTILYACLKSIFPDSKILKAIGDAFKAKFRR
jgi:hypothetical protein